MPHTLSLHPWLRPLPLAGGRRSLPDRILPGPMEGITAASFVRVLTARRLVTAWVTPFIRLSTGVPRDSRLREKLAEFQPPAGALPVVVQLMGTDIPLLAATAARLAALGVAGVDLNCACPSKVVLSHGGGGARLADPGWIRDALLALRQAAPGIGVSVKLRTGMKDASAELPGILAAASAARPDFIMLHYRTVAEGYRPAADGWDRVARARERLPAGIPLLASGDVFSAADAMELHRRTGADGVTPARGLLRNPWLLEEIRAACRGEPAPPAPSAAAKEAFLLSLVEDARGHGAVRRGFILEMARNLFGTESAVFRRFAGAADLRGPAAPKNPDAN